MKYRRIKYLHTAAVRLYLVEAHVDGKLYKMFSEDLDDLKRMIDSFIQKNGPVDVWDKDKYVYNKFKHIHVNFEGYYQLNEKYKDITMEMDRLGIKYRAIINSGITDIVIN